MRAARFSKPKIPQPLSSKYITFKEHIMADKEKEILEENYNLEEDFEDEEEIVTLHNENTDKDEDFRVVWYIEDGGKNYLFLNPSIPATTSPRTKYLSANTARPKTEKNS